MIKQLLALATVFAAVPVFAENKYNHMTCDYGACTYSKRFTAPVVSTTTPKPIPTPVVSKKVYRPFTYETPCALEAGLQTYFDICKVVETRENGGALRTRNIYSNKHGLTIRGRFDKQKGYMTWDSHNKFEYKWEYKVGGNQEEGLWTYVMPGFLVQNVSWD